MRRIHIQPRSRGGKRYYTALYYLADGSGRSAGTFTSKAKARAEAEVAWQKSREGNWVDPDSGKKTLTAYAEGIWLPSITVEKSTYVDYESLWRNHVKPEFGSRAISTILATEVSTWINKMEDGGLGRAQQRKAYVVLNMIMKAALRDRIISSLPTEGVKTKPIPRHEPRIFSRDQWERFLAVVPERYRALLEVGVATGLRASELRALAPDQIAWHRRKILVTRALVEVGKKRFGSRYATKEYPKGKRAREVTADQRVLEILAEEIQRQGLTPSHTGPIFLFNDHPIDPTVMSRIFRNAREAAGIDRTLTLKHLRSSRASWLLKDTGDLVMVQRELGHADIATTQKYLAVVEETETDNVTAFEDFLKRRTAS